MKSTKLVEFLTKVQEKTGIKPQVAIHLEITAYIPLEWMKDEAGYDKESELYELYTALLGEIVDKDAEWVDFTVTSKEKGSEEKSSSSTEGEEKEENR
jgi:hypothetical protein